MIDRRQTGDWTVFEEKTWWLQKAQELRFSESRLTLGILEQVGYRVEVLQELQSYF